MSDLPDLSTGSISYLAYWNAIDDGGAPSVDPTNVTSDPNINNYTLFDNGLDIDSYSSVVGRNIKARVKNDGWVLAWIDRTENIGVQKTSLSDARGWWDIANDWTTEPRLGGGSPADFINNTLERTIKSLNDELSAGATYNTSDVGLYNYQYQSATNSTGGSIQGSGDPEPNPSNTAGFSYTASTNILAGVAFSYINAVEGNGNVTGNSTWLARPVDIVDVQNGEQWGAVDITGDIPSSGTEYQLDWEVNTSLSGGSYGANNQILIIWS